MEHGSRKGGPGIGTVLRVRACAVPRGCPDPEGGSMESNAEGRYLAALERVADLVPADVYRELEDAVGGYLLEERRSTLNQLVIGTYDTEGFPRTVFAVTTEGARPVEIDECEHRGVIRMMERERDRGDDRLADYWAAVARAILETELGNPEAPRLHDDALAMLDGAAS